MNAALAELLAFSTQSLLAGFIVFLRVGAAMALLPAFGETAIPARVRLVVALAFTLVVLPAVRASIAPLHAAGSLPGQVLATEVLAGLALGAILRISVLALQIAGTIAAQATSLAQLFGGGAGEPQPAIGHLMTWGGLALAVSLGLHVTLAGALIGSYDAMPAGQFPGAESIRQWGVGGVAHGFALAFTLAAPFVLAGLVYNVALGAINRAMPQLMVAFVGAPALTAGGLLLLVLCIPAGLALWHNDLSALVANPFEAWR
ncbi:MAG: flagellar biosynthetic protein FliR [Phaeovulum sp.]|jgi:flagellar biosynthetic protein FliR|uniref:flagellar biosynthetic protein FliR n=1 Tax=Phaeovulum sp. TaxID=2934796 RepID=UPI002730D8AF|nr:flagellar biosynthetic protein FliR [Phaeovulum sp.]MDP2062225.1 flagellar biosynthetic protein FliR [Phaeovulum sp.]MDP3862206.1 flagellar biosynthetic protein FliR [Phaeovulum sp.]